MLSERGSEKGSAAAASDASATGQRGSYLISDITYDSVWRRAAGTSFSSRWRMQSGCTKVHAGNARCAPPRHQRREGQAHRDAIAKQLGDARRSRNWATITKLHALTRV